ncbi:MAG: class I SAM-dependent methyltransferase [Acidobacteria bacterium]|nr:MAG: class I SAM-dependent methyltransferase [Acidobacteriota bacterium]REK10423.1 MAG: class I SAM-dependent methyltransferase [Acidobacteriota bacterium]
MSDRNHSRGTSEDGDTRLARFVGGEPTRDLDDWHWLWSEDVALPIGSHRGGLIGRLVVAFKRLLRPLVKTPQQDLWDRQRVFDLIVIERLRRIEDLRVDLDALERRVSSLEACLSEGLREVARYNDALYSRVDLKLERALDRCRLLQRDLASALRERRTEEDGQQGGPELLEHAYLEFERRHRGSEEEIRDRLAGYVGELAEHAPVLDLGCGRGELLRLLRDAGVESRGVDGNRAMVRRCREDHGLEVRHRDLVEELRLSPPGSLGAVTCLHVVEHLPLEVLRTMLREALAVLRPGGLLLVETPSPLSLVAGSRNFWVDSTHLRPVHPEQLVAECEAAGFADIGFETCHPFAELERLPPLEPPVTSDGPPGEALEAVWSRVARLRDELDSLLFGDQDYTLRASKPG